MAMECRCYHGGEGRTRLKQLKFTGEDFKCRGGHCRGAGGHCLHTILCAGAGVRISPEGACPAHSLPASVRCLYTTFGHARPLPVLT